MEMLELRTCGVEGDIVIVGMERGVGSYTETRPPSFNFPHSFDTVLLCLLSSSTTARSSSESLVHYC